MNGYLTTQGASGLDALVPGAQLTLPGRVPPHGTEPWTMTFDVTQAGMHTFGVYPLAAQLSSAGAELDVARTLLPFWPGKQAARTVKPLTIGWVWPLIDTPQRGACPALLSNELAASVAPDGRLYSLLAAGQSAAGRRAMITWAIDPALMSDLSVMKQPYRVSARADCSGGKTEQPSRPAAAWLSDVKELATEQDFFVTPYADVDMAAMAHHGLDSELTAAFADGQLTAQQLLGRTQRATPAAPGVMAWPGRRCGGLQRPRGTGREAACPGDDHGQQADAARSASRHAAQLHGHGGDHHAQSVRRPDARPAVRPRDHPDPVAAA